MEHDIHIESAGVSSGLEVIPSSNSSYSTQQYWEDRYKKDPQPFDWFKGYDELKEILGKHIQRNQRILMVGCGNSTLSEEMYKDGFENIVNIDFAKEVIDFMASRCKDMTNMKWFEMDAMNMNFESESFDVAIDKGTMDAIMCEQTSVWEVDEKLAKEIDRELSEVSRVLKGDGLFLYITFGQPHFRKNLLLKEKYGWDLLSRRFLSLLCLRDEEEQMNETPSNLHS